MTAPQPAHRLSPQRGPVQSVARLLFGQLLAVIGIAAAITAVAIAVGPDNDDEVSAVVPSHSSTPTGTPTGPPSTPVTPSTSVVPPPASSAPATTPSDGSGPVKVDVLNQSAPGGEAGRVARRLRDAGWSIGRVDDFHGNVRRTTVYWLDPEQRRQARQVSQFLGGIRVQEGFDTLVEGRVSIVLVAGD